MKANADAARVAGRRRDIGKCSAECSAEFFAYISAECGAANDPCGLGALISCRPAGSRGVPGCRSQSRMLLLLALDDLRSDPQSLPSQ